MKKINLRELYPLYYKKDYYIEVSDEVAAQLEQADRNDEAYRIRTLRHKAYYSLDVSGIENDILFVQASFNSVQGQQGCERTLFFNVWRSNQPTVQ